MIRCAIMAPDGLCLLLRVAQTTRLRVDAPPNSIGIKKWACPEQDMNYAIFLYLRIVILLSRRDSHKDAQEISPGV